MYAFTVLCFFFTPPPPPRPPPFFSFFSSHPGFFCGHFDIDVCLYSTCTFVVVVVVDCQADFNVDNVQRRELVNLYGV